MIGLGGRSTFPPQVPGGSPFDMNYTHSAMALRQASERIDPRAHVRRVVAQSRSSFLWGMQALGAERRRAIYAVYAFSREVDNIVDEPGDLAEKKRALAAWREEIDRLYAQRPRWPTTQALLQPIRRFQLPQEEFMAILDGMETDASPAVRMQTLDDLLRYCRRVAGAVGVLSIHIFGTPHPPGPLFAEKLGNAFQLTNILRDLKEDADSERLYVPLCMLERHGVEAQTLEAILAQPGFAAACAELTAIARRYYREADALMAQLGWWRRRPPVLMRAVYKATLDRLEERGWTALDRPVRPSKARSVWLALRHGFS